MNGSPNTFLQRLEQGIIRVDGSMGYLLAGAGVPRDQSFDALNLSDPKPVREVHRQYLDVAQVDLLETNTFGANRVHLASFDRGLEHLVTETNRRGVALAREAAEGTSAMIAGSVGPISHRAEGQPAGRELGVDEIREIYQEQIQALGNADVDCFMIETVHRHEEGITALQVARDLFPEIPAVFQITCSRHSSTVYGDDVETLVRAADDADAAVIGLNCFLDPAEMYAVIQEMRGWTRRPLAAQPNVGRRTTLCEGVYEVDRSLRATVSNFGQRLVDAGARVIGGCCGITPLHIELLRNELATIDHERLEVARQRHQEHFDRARKVSYWHQSHESVPAEPRSRLEADALSDDPSRRPVLVEIDPPHGGRDELDRIAEGLKLIYSGGIRYITIGDNPGREPRLDRYLFSRMVLDCVPEVELVLHLACADRTLVSFSTELESLFHITPNVLVISGDPPTGDFAISSAPYDLRSVKAIRSFTQRNYGVSLLGEEGWPPTSYFVGGAFNPRAVQAQARKFSTKALHAGASFAMTQPIFDVETVNATAEVFAKIKERVRQEQGRELSVYPGVMPFTTLRNAKLLRDRFGMPVSKKLLEHLGTLPAEQVREVGQDSAQQVLQAIHRLPDVFAGVYYIPQFHAYQRALDLLRSSGWLEG